MSVLAPPAPATRVRNLTEWQALPEDDGWWRTECVAGELVMAAAPLWPHQWAVQQLYRTVESALEPRSLLPLPDIDVVLRRQPLTVRRPDVAVVQRSALTTPPRSLTADDVLLAVEVLSPGNASTDTVVKIREYAQGGIGEYWILDPEAQRLHTYRLDTSGRYQPGRTLSAANGPAEIALLGTVVQIDVAAITTL